MGSEGILRRLALSLPVLFATAVLSARVGMAQPAASGASSEDPATRMLSAARSDYRFAEWPGKTGKVRPGITISDVVGEQLGDVRLHWLHMPTTIPRQLGGWPAGIVDALWQSQQGDVQVRVWVATSCADAQEALLRRATGVQSAARLPLGADIGVALGDVSIGSGPGRTSFVRANIMVEVDDRKRVDALHLAHLIDQAILARPGFGSYEQMAAYRPQIKTLRFRDTLIQPIHLEGLITGGVRFPLVVEAVDPEGGPVHLSWSGKGASAQEAVGEKTFTHWAHLGLEGPENEVQQRELTLTAVNECGMFTTATLPLTVTVTRVKRTWADGTPVREQAAPAESSTPNPWLDIRQRLRTAYEFGSWPGKTGPVRPGIDVVSLLRAAAVPVRLGQEPGLRWSGIAPTVVDTRWMAVDSHRQVKLWVAESCVEAQDVLMGILSLSSAPILQRRYGADGTSMGDVCFAAGPGWALFVRNNIVVQVDDDEEEGRATELAQLIDQAILARPAFDRYEQMAAYRPQIKTLRFRDSLSQPVHLEGRAHSGARLPLIVEVVDPQGGPVHLSWSGKGASAQEAVGEKTFTHWAHLGLEGPENEVQQRELTLTAVNECGMFTTATLPLTVTVTRVKRTWADGCAGAGAAVRTARRRPARGLPADAQGSIWLRQLAWEEWAREAWAERGFGHGSPSRRGRAVHAAAPLRV